MIQVITICQGNPFIKYKGYNFFKGFYIFFKEYFTKKKYHTMNFCIKWRLK